MGRHKKPDKLTRENAQALAAGMSYGKWKALQPVPVKEETPPLPIYNMRKCAYCGLEFRQSDGSGRKKYCSDRCCKAAYDKKYRERQRVE